VEAKNKEDSNRRIRITNHDGDPLSNDNSDHEDDTVERTKSTYHIPERIVPPKINLENMVERQQKMMNFICQYNTEQLEQGRSSTSDLKDTFKMALPKHYCGGD
jgi:hypothetical protein